MPRDARQGRYWLHAVDSYGAPGIRPVPAYSTATPARPRLSTEVRQHGNVIAAPANHPDPQRPDSTRRAASHQFSRHPSSGSHPPTMASSRVLGPQLRLLSPGLSRPALAPNGCRRAALALPRLSVRCKSGPYGYTQAKALVYAKNGEPADVLKLHTHSISPSIPSTSVLVRCLAAPINPADINTIQGTYGSKQPLTSLIGTSEPSAVPGNEGVFEVLATGSPQADLKKGDWVIPAASQIGTWRTHAVFAADELLKVDKEGLTPTQVSLVSVNPCTAYRILRSYGPSAGIKAALGMRPLDVGSGQWFIQNGANSGVGRAAIQFGKLWGLRSINIIRDRDTMEATDALKQELHDLGADVVVPESQFLSREWKDRLAEITRKGREQIGLGLNCVGGKSATALARSLGEGATLVSYGGMAKQPVALPVGLLIFKDIRFVGFWLSKWNQQDVVGRRHMVADILGLMRDGKFRDAPVDEVKWDWDTEEATLRDAAQRGLQGFRQGKGVFVFGDT
ncbi:alcohol dehydrogenase superfamily, zinc-containing [Purpureocillium lavendulum]|uniref:enoyl-[acyl-carrier-protein] reductase n=1 Tax=Purpureocillium lavendulum TaxID=1247861 RepID=A0AB34FY22_9HYPO|nr:alcohol dehydrogenase superfamily, zinc-containing [Purpureocillium lavendulum]